jgi:hypothetical protein
MNCCQHFQGTCKLLGNSGNVPPFHTCALHQQRRSTVLPLWHLNTTQTLFLFAEHICVILWQRHIAVCLSDSKYFIVRSANRARCHQPDALFIFCLFIPLHVSALLVAHHQEVPIYVCASWYVLYVSVDCQLAIQTCWQSTSKPKTCRNMWLNKLKIKSI